MEIYYKNLYENIFSEQTRGYRRLRVVSGYASSDYLSRIISEFPNLEIELFIGMTFQGVSNSDHSGFKSVMQKNDNVKVYYQVLGIPNHMKIYEFSSVTDKKIFIGSANFSENGFFKHKEILAEVLYLPEILFVEQQRNSLLCTDPKIDRYIDFYENEYEEFGDMEEEKHIKADATRSENKHSATKKRERARHKWELLRQNIDPQYHRSFDITIMLPPENNPRWDDRGINSWVNNKTPVIEQTPRLSFSLVFPREEFIIYTDDNQVLKAKLTGRFNGNLDILNVNLYDYIRGRIGLLEKRPISYQDLVLSGYTTLYLTRVNNNEYIMSFNKNDKLF